MNIKRTFIGFSMAILSVFVFTNISALAKSTDEINSEINEIEQKQKEINKQQDDLKKNHRNVQSKIKTNKREQKEIKQEIKQIDDQLVTAKLNIDDKETEIFETNKEIDELTDQLKQLKKDIKEITERLEKREDLLKSRLRSIQENDGEIGFIEVLLGSDSFLDLISRSNAVLTIMGQDKNLIEEHTTDKKELETKKVTVQQSKNEVESKMNDLQEQKKELLALKDTLDEQVATKEKLLAQLDKEYKELDDYRVTIAEEQKAMDAQATSLDKAKKLAKQEKSRLQTLANNSGNGTFIWPANGRQSSGYGARIHPIYKTKIVHHGVDVAVPVGTPLKAAGSGVVSVGRSMGGYGNVIMITHVVNGQQLTTVYAHLSSISVSPGEVVQQGQVIGATGNSGNSTGPHLHFEVHKGGWNSSRSNSTNPIHYLP